MKRRVALLCSLLFSATVFGKVPAVLDLRDVSPLRDWFQLHADSARLIAILSPSCATCIQGFAEVQKTLQNISDPHLQVAVVWAAVWPRDERKAAVNLSSHFTDGRLTYFWDPYRASGETWQSVLKLKGAAWDVYLVYKPGAIWNEPDLDPGPPAVWMHQLKEVPQAPELNQQQLEQQIRSLLKNH